MKSVYRAIVNFLQREWFLIITGSVVILIIYLFESF
jgi:hypothetical protein